MPPMDDSNPLGLRTQVSRQLPLPCQRQIWEETHWPALGCLAPPEPPAGAGGKEKSHALASSAESRAQTEVPRPAKWSDEKGGPACHSACHVTPECTSPWSATTWPLMCCAPLWNLSFSHSFSNISRGPNICPALLQVLQIQLRTKRTEPLSSGNRRPRGGDRSCQLATDAH